MALAFRMFDCDNHYYEGADAYTRHLDRAMGRRAIQWATIDGKRRLLAAGKVWRFIPNPTFDPVARPGCLDDYYRGKSPRGQDIVASFGELEPIRAEYRDRDARLAVMDAQGVEGCFLFPTQGVGLEEALRHDPEALYATLRAFNVWLDETWGFHHEERLFAAPLLALVDPERAVAELQFVLERGARIVCLRPGPVLTPGGGRSPGDAAYDGFWGLASESGVVVAYHGGDSGYDRYAADFGEGGDFLSFKSTPFRSIVYTDRPIFETIAALVVHGVLARHRRLRLASIEIGAMWVPELAWRLRKSFRMTPGAFHEDPVETLRRHLWASPFYEDDIRAVTDALGIDHVLMGSDWPHAEGLPQPADYRLDLARQGFDDEETRRIMRDNGLALSRPLVAA